MGRKPRYLMLGVLAAIAVGPAHAKAPAPAKSAARIAIPAGPYRPLMPGKNEAKRQPVAAFALDETPVTNADFTRFTEANPRWRPGVIPALFADANYLSRWAGPKRLAPDAPVTYVSYFAADAYCAWRGGRLPTTAEWEYVGAASETLRDGRDDPAYQRRILKWYGRPADATPAVIASRRPNVYGVHDMHGLIWEWTSDFNSVLVTGESRSDSALDRGLFCGAGALGAADPSDYAAFMRTAFRSSLEGRYTGAGLGFRCAWGAQTRAPKTPIKKEKSR